MLVALAVRQFPRLNPLKKVSLNSSQMHLCYSQMHMHVFGYYTHWESEIHSFYTIDLKQKYIVLHMLSLYVIVIFSLPTGNFFFLHSHKNKNKWKSLI